ncbi:MAG: transketolase [Defluviitaleaceae bacterium]|nr:transketolase [Defluviitaleaceae bacterium]
MSQKRIDELVEICAQMRIDLIKQLHKIQTGHPGGSLSVCEILALLYLEIAKVDPKNPKLPERDRILLTKGHAAPMLYLALARAGFFPQEEFSTLRQINSRLQGHPDAKTTPGVEAPSGPMGLGLSAAVGMALALKLDKNPARVYAVMGDGELNEGTVWEACMSIAKFGIDNLTPIVDFNGVQLDGLTNEIMPMLDLGAKFSAFGFEVINCDGHNIADLYKAISTANSFGKPSVILAKTIKGKGVSFMEGKNAWHGAPIDDANFAIAMKELEGNANG